MIQRCDEIYIKWALTQICFIHLYLPIKMHFMTVCQTKNQLQFTLFLVSTNKYSKFCQFKKLQILLFNHHEIHIRNLRYFVRCKKPSHCRDSKNSCNPKFAEDWAWRLPSYWSRRFSCKYRYFKVDIICFRCIKWHLINYYTQTTP